jgi:hypothetical protein
MLAELASSTLTVPPMLLASLPTLSVFALFVFFYRRTRKSYANPPKFAGPPLAGTAQILWVLDKVRSGATPDAPPDYKGQPIRRVRAGVKIPGHEAYETSSMQVVPRPILSHIAKHGGTFAVQADSANLKYVRIDFDQPIA